MLQLLDEVESLAISRPVDIKRGARFSDEVRQFEVSLIRTALGRTSGSQTRAARLLIEANDTEREDQAVRDHGINPAQHRSYSTCRTYCYTDAQWTSVTADRFSSVELATKDSGGYWPPGF